MSALAKIADLLTECHEILSASNEEDRLVQRVRYCREVCGQQVDGSPACHRANFDLIDAYAALDKFRKNASHEQGYFV